MALSNEEKINKIYELLPELDCAACGFDDCEDYARQIVEENEATDLCEMGDDPEETDDEIKGILDS